jgi:hypothetical protein
MLSRVFKLHEWLDQCNVPRVIPSYKRGPYQHHKDRLPELEPIFAVLLDHPDVPGFMMTLATRINVHRSTLSTWKRNLLEDPTWRPRREHYSLVQRIFTDLQELELSDRIATKYIDRGLFYSDADFKIDALRFYQEIVCRSEEIVPGTA